MTLLSDIETIKSDIAAVLKIGADQVPLSQKELLVYGILVLLLNRSSEGGAGGVAVNNEALAAAIADALKTITQPVSAVSLPLPTGAATSIKQPAIGVAGTPSADVITVQGIANGIAQPVNQQSNAVTATTAFSSSPTSSTFAIANRLALIVIPIITGAPTLTLQVSLDGGTTWASTSVTATTSASNPTIIEADSLAKVSGAFGLANAFRFTSGTSITATLSIRSIIQ